MSTLTVAQTGAQFAVSWSLDTPEAVELWRTEPDDPDVQIATLPATVVSFVDERDELDPGDTVEYKIVGVTSSDELTASVTAALATIPALDDERRYLAAMLMAARLWKRRDSPLGVAGGNEFGPVPLGFKDPDVEALLVGLRRSVSVLTSQTWPTLAEFKEHVKAPESADDDAMTITLQAGIEIVKVRCSTSVAKGLA